MKLPTNIYCAVVTSWDILKLCGENCNQTDDVLNSWTLGCPHMFGHILYIPSSFPLLCIVVYAFPLQFTVAGCNSMLLSCADKHDWWIIILIWWILNRSYLFYVVYIICLLSVHLYLFLSCVKMNSWILLHLQWVFTDIQNIWFHSVLHHRMLCNVPQEGSKPTRDHHNPPHLRFVHIGSPGGAWGGSLPGEAGWNTTPHGSQRSLGQPAAFSIRQDALWDGGGPQGQWGERNGKQMCHGMQTVLQWPWHPGVTIGRGSQAAKIIWNDLPSPQLTKWGLYPKSLKEKYLSDEGKGMGFQGVLYGQKVISLCRFTKHAIHRWTTSNRRDGRGSRIVYQMKPLLGKGEDDPKVYLLK